MTSIKAAALLVLSLTWQSPAPPQDSAKLLSDFTSGTDRAQRELILFQLSEQHLEVGPALLKIAMEGKDDETRWLAIRGLGWLQYKGAAPFLKESLRSSSTYVRANAARALGDMHDASAAGVLIRTLLADEDDDVLQQTSAALMMLSAKDAIPALEWRSRSGSPQTRIWIIGAIEALGSKDVPFFAGFLFDQNEVVAAYAAHA